MGAPVRRARHAPRYGGLRAVRNLVLALLLALPGMASARTTVVALGDSLTAGYGLPADQGFVPRLQAWLDDHGADVEVQNAGVSGDTTAGGLSRVDWALGDDADAVIVALGGNDFLRGIDPVVVRENLHSILEKTSARDLPVLLVGIDASSNYGPDYEQGFDALYPELAQEFDALVEPDWFAALRQGGGNLATAMATFMQPDGIHPNELGVDRIVERLGPRVLELVERADP
ncbi:arylesterase [Rubellimicrobium rubrum]|uniref:Arylesterase n=1 Tax=Rubellimicrobium rubrum TaxID=2585369 RepID=A0A5C4MWP1_9RHOB|nr:arylesterase [Rubellimicrobium rubrum]TNC49010.1 arylesterase [Rubellimicrobium rubrum]